MNPEQNRSGMTVNALMQTGLILSTAIPVLFFAILGFVASLALDRITLVLVIVACAIVVLVGALIVNYFVQRRIKERILGLVDVARDYAGGDRTVRAVVNGDDDFAMLAMSLNTLLDNQGSSTNISLSSGGSDAAALQAQIEKLLQEVSAVGDGDLRVQAEVTPDTLGVLADSFNYMIEELAKVVGRVQSTAVQVTNATRRILDRSAELAQASETQVSQIAQTTEAVEALAGFIQNVARNSQLSAEVAQDALRNAASGQQSVRQTIEGMLLIRENVQETAKKIKRLGERSNEIGEIVRIIEDIADQTNLLALNAAIQSAMAGEHGRGFAVVADEIRLLAERSTESTKRIATLVKSIQGDTYEAVVAMEDSTQEVVKGSQLADEAGRSLNSIYSAVERQAQMIESIARAANEQTTVSEAVAVAMGRISEITRQTDAGTQEAAVSVSYLAELSEQLRASVSTFRLPDRGNEMLGTFSNMTSVTEMPDANGSQMFGSGMDGDWGQSFSGNFPPLPEPGNSGSLVPLTSRAGGQFGFNNQQDFGGQQNFGGQPNFGGQQNFGGQPNFGGQQAFANASNAGSQQPFNGGQLFGGAAEFGDLGSLESQQGGFSGSNWYSPPQQPGAAQGFGGQNQGQQFYQSGNQTVQSPNSGLLPPSPQPGQPTSRQQRWQGGSQQYPNQPPFNHDQGPFRDNG
ncbi:MAG: HAMP domain-containing protein [Chloroflexi bacterium]|nr:HAMP domain-containing protein [Chloroflexota bacterium]